MTQSRKYIKPGTFTRKINNGLARFGHPSVSIPGRKSGVLRKTSVIPVTVEGRMYVVSTRGDSDWVLNLKAAGEGVLKRGWRSKPFRAIEVAGDERQRVIAHYRRRVGAEVNQYFDKLPDLADHPTFRLEF
jgi:deazaflavin-dependent oxidoreductase (nitroreductase family)